MAILAGACGGASGRANRPVDAAGEGALEQRIADLRLALADDPRDPRLHVELGRALLRARQPGGALRHLEEAARRRDLETADAQTLAGLYLARARARLALGDGGAWLDIDAARRIDPAALRRDRDRAAKAEPAAAERGGGGGTAPGSVEGSRGAASPGAASPGAASPGAFSSGAASPGAFSSGAASPGAFSSGAASQGAAPSGAVSSGAASQGAVSSSAASQDAVSPSAASRRMTPPGPDSRSLVGASPGLAGGPIAVAHLTGDALVRESLFAGALAALRRADRPGRRDAARLLARAERLAPRDSRLAWRDPAAADLADVGAAGAWLADGGARRAALDVYREYVRRGGRGSDHLRRYLLLHRWWFGDRERPGPALLEEMRAERFDLCAAARAVDEIGCAGSLARAAENDPPAAEAIRRLASARGWRATDPSVAGAWALVALRAWLDGRVGSWEAEVSARVDLTAVLGDRGREGRIPVEARATLLRAAGRAAQARGALDRAAERAASLSPEARALLVAEAAAQGRGEAAVDALLRAGPASPTAWQAALVAARRTGPGGLREAALCDAAPVAAARAHLRRSGELGALAARFPSPEHLAALARWREAMASSGADRLAAAATELEARWRRLAAGSQVPARRPERLALPLGVVDPHRVALAGAVVADLERVTRAYLRDPALADRLAGGFADGEVAVGQRGPLLVDLFARLGDPARALDWAERVLASSPDHAPYLLLAGLAAASAGDAARADVYFVRGAGASGDTGAASLLAARGFLAASLALPALTAARRAFDLTAPGEPEHAQAIELAAHSLDRLGRRADAAGLRARLSAGARAEAALDLGLATPPGAAGPVVPSPDQPGWAIAVASLLAIGLDAPPDRAGPALAAAADSLERAGLAGLALAVRRERSSLAGIPLPGAPGAAALIGAPADRD